MASLVACSPACDTTLRQISTGSCSAIVPIFTVGRCMMPNSKVERPSLQRKLLHRHKWNHTMCAHMPCSREVGKNDSNIRIFSGSSNPALAQEIADYLGLDPGSVLLKRFADSEMSVRFLDSVMGRDVYIVQPTCKPASENKDELIFMIDACRRAGAKTITAVIPYFGYARGDRMNQDGESITAKVIADQIALARPHRVLVLEFHAGQIMGFFSIPLNHVSGVPVIVDYLASRGLSSKDLVVVSPDIGGVSRARDFSNALCDDAPLAIIDKKRTGPNAVQVMNLIGDVQGKVAIMFDDIIDTAGTMAQGAALLRQKGAKEVYGCAIHAVFSAPAIERLSNGLFDEVIVTNSIPVLEENYFPQLTVLSVANLLAEKIWHIPVSYKI